MRQLNYISNRLTVICLGGTLFFGGCQKQETVPDQSPTSDPYNSAVGFTAKITGSFQGDVSGPGIITYVQPSRTPIGDRPGYYFIADNSGIRDYGITMILPTRTTRGEHPLVSVSPFEIGTQCEVRVDRDMGQSTLSYGDKTKGVISLDAFPSAPDMIPNSQIAGSFSFTTHNFLGEEISVEGIFSYEGK